MNRSFRRLQNRLPSVNALRNRMTFLSGVKPKVYHCCVKSCVCYTGQYKDLRSCPYCKEARYHHDGKTPRKVFHYLPVTQRLKTYFSDEGTASKMQYRADYKTRGSALDEESGLDAEALEDYWDIFDGDHYLSLLSKHVSINEGEALPHTYFSDKRDIALGLSFDGFCPFKKRKETCWPIILFNYNLPPEERFQLHNLICLGVIPGPKQMKNSDSFLYPFIEEMLQLAEGVETFDILDQEVFNLHAYLIVAFGDIPAVAKLMCMKGVNGRVPCRECSIEGIRLPPPTKVTAHYVPLSRPHGTSYDPMNLPHRTHASFMADATHVLKSKTGTEYKTRSTACGIKGIPILSSLHSLRFPTSFPFDFMHLVWENVIQTLTDLWCGKFKGLDEGTGDYRLKDSVWKAIGAACKKSGDTIPAVFGGRVPNIAEERSHFIAETWALWGQYVAPVLLRRRFKNPVYYTHFVKLVALLNMCLQFRISPAEIDKLEIGLAQWVKEFERFVSS